MAAARAVEAADAHHRKPDVNVSTVSVLVCTHNRAAMLQETLTAMQSLTPPDRCNVEIVVVDNNSRDDTPGVVTAAADSGRFRVVSLKESQQGKGFALNVGLAKCSGEIVALTDDDVLPDKDWLRRIVETFRTRELTFVFGKVLPRWGRVPPPELLMLPAQAIWGPLALLDYGDAPAEYLPDSVGQRLPIGANLAISRQALVTIGGWRTDLGKVDNTLLAGEDHEIFMRLRRFGLYTGYYDPQISVQHFVPASRLTRRYFRRWFYWNGKTQALMLQDLYPTIDMTAVPRIAGAPRFVVRQAFEQLAGWLVAVHTATPLDSLIAELRLISYAGLFVQCWSLHRRVKLAKPTQQSAQLPMPAPRKLP
jgi:glycosyltransferase involved in cell wall biosynthesis